MAKSKRERKPRHLKREELQKYFGVDTMAELEAKYGEKQSFLAIPEEFDENGKPLYMVLDEEN